jgi:hypothetical protein
LWAEARAAGAIHESRYDEFGVQRDPGVFFGAVRLTADEVLQSVAYGRSLRRSLAEHVPAPELYVPVAIQRPLPDQQPGPPEPSLATPARRPAVQPAGMPGPAPFVHPD